MEVFGVDSSIGRLFTPSRCYTCVRSRYAATTSVSTSELYAVELLGQNTSSSAERSRLETKRESIQKVRYRRQYKWVGMWSLQELDAITEEKHLKQNDYEEFHASYTEARKQKEDINQQKKELERRSVSCFHHSSKS